MEGLAEQAAGGLLLVMQKGGKAVQTGDRVPLTVEHAFKTPIATIVSSGADGLPDIRGRLAFPVDEIGGVVEHDVRRQNVVSVPVQILLIPMIPFIFLIGHLRQQGQLLGICNLERVLRRAGAARKGLRRLDVHRRVLRRASACPQGQQRRAQQQRHEHFLHRDFSFLRGRADRERRSLHAATIQDSADRSDQFFSSTITAS